MICTAGFPSEKFWWHWRVNLWTNQLGGEEYRLVIQHSCGTWPIYIYIYLYIYWPIYVYIFFRLFMMTGGGYVKLPEGSHEFQRRGDFILQKWRKMRRLRRWPRQHQWPPQIGFSDIPHKFRMAMSEMLNHHAPFSDAANHSFARWVSFSTLRPLSHRPNWTCRTRANSVG